MPNKIDFFDLMTGHVDKDATDCWFDDAQFESIPHKLLLPPYSVNLSLVYPKDELDDLPLTEKDDDDMPPCDNDFELEPDDAIESSDDDLNDFMPEEDEDDINYEPVKRLPVREVTVNFVHGLITDSIMNSNMEDSVKWKIIRMLGTSEAHIVKPDDLTDDAMAAWDDWAYNLEKLNSHTNGYTALTNFKGHLYPSRNVLDDSDVEFRIINLPDVKFLPFND